MNSLLPILSVVAFWAAVILISIVWMGSTYYLKRRTRQLGHSLAMRAFESGASAPEVERLLIAWHGEEAPALDFTHGVEMAKKNSSAGKAYTSPAEAGY